MFTAGAYITLGRVLIVYGDSDGETITVAPAANNTLRVTIDDGRGSGAAGNVDGVLFSKSNFDSLEIYGYAGADSITLGEAAGDTYAARVYGGDCGDLITCGSLGETIFGEGGNDTIDGFDGNDYISGGDGNDSIVGGRGNDSLYGDAGADSFDLGFYDLSDGNDYVDGGTGTDSVQHDNAGDTLTNI